MSKTNVLKLNDYGRDSMRLYGEATIEDRALPDFRDGFKPVQRRIMFAAFKLNLTHNVKPKKSARLVGDVIGKYHAHGEAAAYQAAVKLVNSTVPPLFGEGNFGTLTESYAAQRYTNIKLSKYGEHTFFNPNYVKVVRYCPNYDGTLKEPIILPALLPNVLINGTSGIAVATTSIVPSFEPNGIIKLIQTHLKKGKLEVSDFAELKFTHKYGGKAVVKTKEEKKEFKLLVTTGVGSIRFIPEYKFIPEKRMIVITGVPPGRNIESALERFCDSEHVQDARDATDKTSNGSSVFEVTLRKTVAQKNYDDVVKKLMSNLETKLHFKVNLTARRFDKKREITRANFHSWSLIKFFDRWIKWRIALEKRMLKHLIKECSDEISYLDLLLLAAKNKDTVRAAWDQKDAQEFLSKKLKITPEQADIILGMQIRALAKLNIEKVIAKKKARVEVLAGLEKDMKNPKARISKELSQLAV